MSRRARVRKTAVSMLSWSSSVAAFAAALAIIASPEEARASACCGAGHGISLPLTDMENAASGNLRVTMVDPDDDPDAASEAEELGIYPVEFNVIREDEFDIRRGYYGYAIRYADRSEVMPIINRTGRVVGAITFAG